MLIFRLRSCIPTRSAKHRKAAESGRRRFRAAIEVLEERTPFATHFVFSEYAPAIPAGIASAFSVTAQNSDGTIDETYTGTLHFTSSDPQAVLPADGRLTKGSATLGFTFKTPGKQSITATDAVLSSITGGLSTQVRADMGQAVFAQAPSADGGLIASSWVAPDGTDGDLYAYDRFRLSSDQTITEIDWRGGYINGAANGRAANFTVAIFDSIAGGSQPLVTNPQLPETPLAKFVVGGNAGEALAGTFGGKTMYDYKFALPTPFQATSGYPYWLRVEAVQTITPDWGISVGTGGDSRHFQFRTDTAQFNFVPNDVAFTLLTMNAVPVNVWQNPIDPLNADGRAGVAPLDVLVIINELNIPTCHDASGKLQIPPPTDKPPPYYDVNGDGYVTPVDALVVINFLNSGVQAEGEASSLAATDMTSALPMSETTQASIRKTLQSARASEARIEMAGVESFPLQSNSLATMRTRLQPVTVPKERLLESGDLEDILDELAVDVRPAWSRLGNG